MQRGKKKVKQHPNSVMFIYDKGDVSKFDDDDDTTELITLRTYCKIKGDILERVCGVLIHSNTLQKLHIHRAMISTSAVECITNTLYTNNRLRSLSFIMCNLDDDGAEFLARVLRVNITLKKLDITQNAFGYGGIHSIFNALRINTTLETLILDDNYVGVQGAIELGNLLKMNSTLTHISLEHCFIDDDALVHIADALMCSTSLKVLLIPFNMGISGIGMEYFLRQAMLLNVSLTRLTCDGYRNTDQNMLEKLDIILERNKHIEQCISRTVLFLIGIRKQKNKEGMGSFGLLPKEIVEMIARRVCATRGQREWLNIIK